MDETLSQSIAQLQQSEADYNQFVKTTRSYQLAIEGVRDAAQSTAEPQTASKSSM